MFSVTQSAVAQSVRLNNVVVSKKRSVKLWRQLLRADERRFRNVQDLLGWPIQLERLRRCRREAAHPGREEGEERQGRRGSGGETRGFRRQDGGGAQSRRRLISERVFEQKFMSRGIEYPIRN
ncbi:unnamed protein product [Bathycoccus prasinos]